MVRHGTAKKRRAGRYGRTKLKNRSWNRWDPNPKVAKELKARWDSSKSPAENLRSLGLQACPNSVTNTQSAGTSSDQILQLFDVPDSDKTSRRDIHPLTLEEEELMILCFTKHGNDYLKMFRDTKGVNRMQYTEGKLRKLGSRFLLLEDDQRHVPVPESLKSFVNTAGPCDNTTALT